MSITQIGLLMDILGFLLMAPTLSITEKFIPFEPVMGEWRWWLRLTAIVLIVLGFAFQLWVNY